MKRLTSDIMRIRQYLHWHVHKNDMQRPGPVLITYLEIAVSPGATY